MDEETKNNLMKQKYLQYTRRNKLPEASKLNDFEPPARKWTSFLLRLDSKPTPPST